MNTEFGFKFSVDATDLIQRSVLRNRHWEYECSQIFRKLVGEEDVFYDIGCNAGYYSLMALSLGVNKVVAFDPDPVHLEILEFNILVNRIDSSLCMLKQCGLSDKLESKIFFRSDVANSGKSGFLPRDAVAEFETNCYPLDALLSNGDTPWPTIMKIDVEGWELQVLKGCVNLLSNAPPRLIIFEHNPGDPNGSEIWELLTNFGYKISRIEMGKDKEEHFNYLAEFSFRCI